MSCNMAARGETLTIVEVDGEKSLMELLRGALSKMPDSGIGKVTGLLEIAGDACEVNLLVSNSSVVAACLDCTRRGTKLGADAIKELHKLLGEAPRSGYLEVMRIDKDALELDIELEPASKLQEEFTIESILEYNRETSENPSNTRSQTLTVTRTVTGPRPSGNSEGGPGDSPRPCAPVLQQDEHKTLDATELASLLVFMLDKSSVVLRSNDPRRLLSEARKASSSDSDAFYRAVIELKNDGIFNVFYYKGRLCSIVYLDPSIFKAKFLKKVDEDSIVKNIESSSQDNGIELMLLYRVECPDCGKVFLADCATGEEGEQEKPEPAEAHRESRKGGLLARLFRRLR